MVARMVVLAVAWAIPFAWTAVALTSGPSDGTAVSSPAGVLGAAAWGESVTVTRVYGASPLAEGDEVLSVDGQPVMDWVDRAGASREGDEHTYRVLRPAQGLDRIIVVPVTLTAYPVGAAVADNIAAVAIAAGVLLAASLAFWQRPRDAATRALLVAAAATPAALTAHPFGTGVSDLAASRGLWPALGGQFLACAGLGALVVFALTFPRPRGWMPPRAAWSTALLPFAGYAAWLLLDETGDGDRLAHVQSSLTVLPPALALAIPLVVAGQVDGWLRTNSREDRVAQRLLLLGAVVPLAGALLLWFLPLRLAGQPLVRGDLLALLLAPVALACMVAAVTRYRLAEVDWALRRSLTQLLAVTLVGVVLLVTVAGVNLAAGNSFESMLVGATVALVLLPLVLNLRRLVARLAYGDRARPERVVAQLRQLEPRTTPEDALHEMLSVLGRSLTLSWAAVEIEGPPSEPPVRAAIGEPRGQPTSVMLQVAGTTVGRLELEVDPSREPFRTRDRRLLEDVGSQVGALVQAIAINRELQRSRERLVTAREEERRRVRRDLHDGLGPSLAAMVMKLEAAQDLIHDDPGRASTLVAQLTEQTRREIDEIRRLVAGLRPPALDQLGLVSSLRQRVDEHNAAARGSRDGMEWTLHADDDLDPLSAAVEVAAYRIVDEAVNNALRHSGAHSCEVRLRRDAGALLIEVSDTGTGLPVSPEPGVGIESMRDRAEELGGTFDLDSDERGTRVVVRLPLIQTDEGAR